MECRRKRIGECRPSRASSPYSEGRHFVPFPLLPPICRSSAHFTKWEAYSSRDRKSTHVTCTTLFARFNIWWQLKALFQTELESNVKRYSISRVSVRRYSVGCQIIATVVNYFAYLTENSPPSPAPDVSSTPPWKRLNLVEIVAAISCASRQIQYHWVALCTQQLSTRID